MISDPERAAARFDRALDLEPAERAASLAGELEQ